MKYAFVGCAVDGYHFETEFGKILIIDKSIFDEEEWEEDILVLLNGMHNWAGYPDYFKQYIQKAIEEYVITQAQADKILKHTNFYSLNDILVKAGLLL